MTKFGRASAPKIEIQLILDADWTKNNISFNVAIYVLDYGENGGEVGFFIKFDNQKSSNIFYSPLSKISRGCVHWGVRDTRFYGT